MYMAETMWNCTSGAPRSSRVRRKPPHSAALEDSGPAPSVAHSVRFSSVSASLRLTGSSNIQVKPAVGWSWRPSPTPGTSATVGTCSSASSSGRPMPDSHRICGDR